MDRIIRVFPYRTSYTPTDEYVFIGRPPFSVMIPEHDEVHISCTFTWDKAACTELFEYWKDATGKLVKLGGVAFGGPVEGFTPGLYIKNGFTFTSRGCDNNCPWCQVPKLEGGLRELDIVHPGHVIQDNNFLQCSRRHKDAVFKMLKLQRGICFKGGLKADLIDSHFINNIQSLRISELWLACDSNAAIPGAVDAVKKLAKAGFNRNKIYCYVLIGDDMEENEYRCSEIYKAGAMPRAQLYRDHSETKTKYTKEWRKFESMWQRPAATVAHMERGTRFEDYAK